jgi:hypothetical protein
MAEEVATSAVSVTTVIGWLYFITNAARVFTYIPQILAVWWCNDGARAISLITWCSWAISHLAAVLYAAFVIHDDFFLGVSGINFLCCVTVVAIASRKRRGSVASRHDI